MIHLIMPTYDTVENGRLEHTITSCLSILSTLKSTKEEWSLYLAANTPSDEAQKEYSNLGLNWVHFQENKGCAGAVNAIWETLPPDDYVVKIDNDIEFLTQDWLGVMASIFRRRPRLGILGLKRDDIQYYLGHPRNPTELVHIATNETELRPAYIELASDICGSCTMFHPLMVKEIGRYETLNGVYGYEDLLYSDLARKHRWETAYLPNAWINHLGEVDSPEYGEMKRKETVDRAPLYQRLKKALAEGMS